MIRHHKCKYFSRKSFEFDFREQQKEKFSTMYLNYNGNIGITVNDWCSSGLTYDQFRYDSRNGYLTILNRGINGSTVIDFHSIKKPDRKDAIIQSLGSAPGERDYSGLFVFEIDPEARPAFLSHRTVDGSPLDPERIEEYVNRASILLSIKKTFDRHCQARSKKNKFPKMGLFWKESHAWYQKQSKLYPCGEIKNTRSFERVFKGYLKNKYMSIAHKGLGNDSTRKVSRKAENLLLSIWRMNDKPFVNRVHELYLEFVSGYKELHDRETGEIYCPKDFMHKGHAIEISVGTVWNYLKDVINETSVYMDRNGNFDYVNTKRPKQYRKPGSYSLSKISMDDVALSRKSIRGWVYKYIAVDVVSGYWFRPAYIVGKPTHGTVMESFRNMFCELIELGMPMPGELEVEYHLMQDIDWLGELFPFVRFCESPTEKRAEHAIKALKYGASKKAGHTRGRWYAKHEAYRSVRNKVSGDFIEPEFQPQTIVADDLADIERHNNELHPLQKTYPGKTRKQVLMENINPNLKPIDSWHLLRYIGNETETSIYNNDYLPVSNEKFELTYFNSLKRLKPNNTEVVAYWLPEEDGSIEKVYIYQDGKYIGEALNRSQFAYNECAIERDEEDERAMLHQNKRLAQYDKFIKEQRSEIPQVGYMDMETVREVLSAPVETIEIPQSTQDEEYEYSEDWVSKAISSL